MGQGLADVEQATRHEPLGDRGHDQKQRISATSTQIRGNIVAISISSNVSNASRIWTIWTIWTLLDVSTLFVQG
jgi:hypothetical protein